MEDKKKANQTPEIKDEELEQVAGGVVVPGKPTSRTTTPRVVPISDEGTPTSPQQ